MGEVAGVAMAPESLSSSVACDVVFPVVGAVIPGDHVYQIFAAICGLEPRVRAIPELAVDRILDTLPLYGGRVTLTRKAKLRIRTPVAEISLVVPLAGKALRIHDAMIRLGAPRIYRLRPHDRLFSWLVTIKGFTNPDTFLEAVQRQLRDRKIETSARVGHRTVLTVRGARIVGFPVLCSALPAQDSLRLQECGIGGRRHVGAGIFAPVSAGFEAAFDEYDKRDFGRPRVGDG